MFVTVGGTDLCALTNSSGSTLPSCLACTLCATGTHAGGMRDGYRWAGRQSALEFLCHQSTMFGMQLRSCECHCACRSLFDRSPSAHQLYQHPVLSHLKLCMQPLHLLLESRSTALHAVHGDGCAYNHHERDLARDRQVPDTCRGVHEEKRMRGRE